MHNNDLISVIVPVYNVAPYLDCCLSSIVNQSYHNLEIILVDDGSTDNSGSKCDWWADNDPRIRVIHKANGGLSSSRNTGIESSIGKYLTFIDSDDCIHIDFIKRMYEAIVQFHTSMCVCGIITFYDDVPPAIEFNPKIELVNREQLFEQLFTERNVATAICPNKMYRKDIFKEIRYPVGRLHEDEATIHLIINCVEQAVWIDQPMYYYRQSPNSITRQAYNKKMLDELWSKEQRLGFFYANNMRELYQKQLYIYCSRIIYHILQLRKSGDESLKSEADVYMSRYIEAYKQLILRKLPFRKKIRLFIYYELYRIELGLKGNIRWP